MGSRIMKRADRLIMSRPRRFPPPWSIEELEACFVVKDSAEQKLAYGYFQDGARPAISSQAPAHRQRGPCVRPCHAEPGVEVWLDRASNQLRAQPESRPNARRGER